MIKNQLVQLNDLLNKFYSGKDRTITFAGVIEGYLIEFFYEDDCFQDLLEALARYKPAGGEFLYDDKSILPLITGAIKIVENLLSSNLEDNG